MRRCPSASRQMRASLTASVLPRTTVSIACWSCLIFESTSTVFCICKVSIGKGPRDKRGNSITRPLTLLCPKGPDSLCLCVLVVNAVNPCSPPRHQDTKDRKGKKTHHGDTEDTEIHGEFSVPF